MPPSSLYSLSLHDALPIFCFRRDYIDTRHKIRSVELCRRTEMIDVHLAGLMKLTGSKMTGKGIGQSQSSSQTRTVGTRTKNPNRNIQAFTRYGTNAAGMVRRRRSEEHTSELQSRGHLVCR